MHGDLCGAAIEPIREAPLVDLARITRNRHGKISTKLENLSSGYSKKDCIARQIIEDAEAAVTLLPNQTVVELTSGNTGTSLATACGIRGYPFVAVISEGNSKERAQMMPSLDAEVVLVEPTSRLLT